MPDKNKHPVNVTSGALGAHDKIERARSPMQVFLSSRNPYDRFAATGSSNRQGLSDERVTKRILTPYGTGNEKKTGSSSMSYKDSEKKKTGSSSKDPEKDGGKKKGTKNK